MKISYPTRRDIPALKALWKEAFGDDDSLIDSFFRIGYSPRRCRLVLSGGAPAAALYWFDVYSEGERFAYLYAVATRKDYRGQGLCRALIADTHTLLRRNGYAGALLVPGNAGLARMYQGMGYRFCTTVRETTESAGEPIEIQKICHCEYAKRRRELLPRLGGIQEGAQLAYLGSYSDFYAGEDFLAAVIKQGDTLICPELLGDEDAAPGLAAALGCREIHYRTPGTGTPFAMYRPLSSDAIPPVYLGLALD